MRNKKCVLTIAGSDCSGGAGIQADLKTIEAHNLYGMSVVTALTAQNTTGVYGIEQVNPDFIEKQLECIFTDIVPDAVKIGMAGKREAIEAIADRLLFYKAENIVIDPVMISTSGTRLLSSGAEETLYKKLFPLGAVITPNIPEAESLLRKKLHTLEDMEQAAKELEEKTGTAILLKGGHFSKEAADILCVKGKTRLFCAERIENSNTHGTGCTLSSAIACGLAEGLTLTESVERAKKYITGAIAAGLSIGKGRGPLNHNWQK